MAKKAARKRKLVASRARARGLPPGSAVHVSASGTGEGRVTMVDFDADDLTETVVDDIRDCFALKDTPTVTWINIAGEVDIKSLEALAEHYRLHPLLLEDALSGYQRPKYEDYGHCVQVVLKVCSWNESAGEVAVRQVSVVVGQGFVISFEQRCEDVFSVIRERLHTAQGRIRRMGADYLAYCLLDTVMDAYFDMLERRGDVIEALEEEVVSRPDAATLRHLHRVRRDGVLLRRAIWPLREAVSELRRGESSVITDEVRPYLADLYDHTIQIIETMEALREILAAMLDTYLSVINNRMNEVMKMLTVIATIFIPLTFVAGVYGMNLEMPEFGWSWAYPAVLAVMASIAIGMVIYFRRKKWL